MEEEYLGNWVREKIYTLKLLKNCRNVNYRRPAGSRTNVIARKK